MAKWTTSLRRLFTHNADPAPAPRPVQVQVEERPGAALESDDGVNALGFSMYARLRQRAGNLLFSPFSARTALAMAYAGAAGETAQQMEAVLRFPPSDESLHETVAASLARLQTQAPRGRGVTIANMLCSQQGGPLLAEFRKLLDRHYGGSLRLVDFERAAEKARREINAWAEERTAGRIRDLVPPGALTSESRLVLANTLHFRGSWESPFEKPLTFDRPFHREQGGPVPVPLMHGGRKVVGYMETPEFQAVDLEYGAADISMLVLLPRRKDGLAEFESRMSGQWFGECVTGLRTREVEVQIPRFKLSWGPTDLGPCLKALGMPSAFDRTQADFSGINGLRAPAYDALFISAVHHKAFVDVNEEGTEAAAATTVEYSEAGSAFGGPKPPVPVFQADHPFVFAIRDRLDGHVLFLGRVTDPTAKD